MTSRSSNLCEETWRGCCGSSIGVAVLLIGSLFPCCAYANEARVELDRQQIPCYGAMTGRIVVTIDPDSDLEVIPNMYNGGMVINVHGPSGTLKRIDINDVFPGWQNGCVKSTSGRVDAGVSGGVDAGVYVTPLLLVKSMGPDFIFAEAGRYELEFLFCEESLLRSAIVELEVVECEDCGLEQYLRYFQQSYMIAAFDQAPKPSGPIMPDGPYYEALAGC